MVARTIYQLSKRADMPFVPVNCGALSPNLVESQLFGHRKGAFTGADRDHKGFFEVANGGTLFLDELGELDKNIQVKLLRFLESGEISRIGDTEPIRSDVRVICATNRDLRTMIAEEEFREDLLYRLNTFEIHLPALRERKADIPALARHLLARAAKRPMEQVEGLLTPDALAVMLDYDWKGNVRELANAMEYAYICPAAGRSRRPTCRSTSAPAAPPRAAAVAVAGAPAILPMPPLGTKTLHDIEMEHILRTLEKNGGNKPTTAKELGISLKTLYNKLNRWEEEKSPGRRVGVTDRPGSAASAARASFATRSSFAPLPISSRTARASAPPMASSTRIPRTSRSGSPYSPASGTRRPCSSNSSRMLRMRSSPSVPSRLRAGSLIAAAARSPALINPRRAASRTRNSSWSSSAIQRRNFASSAAWPRNPSRTAITVPFGSASIPPTAR